MLDLYNNKKSTRDREAMKLPARSKDYGVLRHAIRIIIDFSAL